MIAISHEIKMCRSATRPKTKNDTYTKLATVFGYFSQLSKFLSLENLAEKSIPLMTVKSIPLMMVLLLIFQGHRMIIHTMAAVIQSQH